MHMRGGMSGKIAPGVIVGGKYQLTRPIGEGAMGTVWAAIHRQIGGEVAVKLILRSDEELRRRLLREAKACGKLKHKNIIEIFDVGETAEGDPFLVMPLLCGETLADRLRDRRRLNPPEAARIGRDVARALSAAHDAGVIHRDLKPANIFLHNEPGEDGLVVKVLDFGVAKNLTAADGLETRTGGIIGSPAYMSPEQAVGSSKVDHRADIWALGVVLFEMLTGVRPFKGDQNQILIAIATAEIPLVSRYVRLIDEGFVKLVARCLERNLDRRVGSAADLGTLLHRFMIPSTPGAALGQSVSGLLVSTEVPMEHVVNATTQPAPVPPPAPAPDGDDLVATTRMTPGLMAAMIRPPGVPAATPVARPVMPQHHAGAGTVQIPPMALRDPVLASQYGVSPREAPPAPPPPQMPMAGSYLGPLPGVPAPRAGAAPAPFAHLRKTERLDPMVPVPPEVIERLAAAGPVAPAPPPRPAMGSAPDPQDRLGLRGTLRMVVQTPPPPPTFDPQLAGATRGATTTAPLLQPQAVEPVMMSTHAPLAPAPPHRPIWKIIAGGVGAGVVLGALVIGTLILHQRSRAAAAQPEAEATSASAAVPAMMADPPPAPTALAPAAPSESATVEPAPVASPSASAPASAKPPPPVKMPPIVGDPGPRSTGGSAAGPKKPPPPPTRPRWLNPKHTPTGI
ncbi:MAG: serine/threonine-protein kinase [Byssovorax sp.]